MVSRTCRTSDYIIYYPFDSIPRKVRSPTEPRYLTRQISRSTSTRMKLAPAPSSCYGVVTPRLRHHGKLRNLTSRISVRSTSQLRCSMTTLISFGENRKPSEIPLPRWPQISHREQFTSLKCRNPEVSRTCF